MADLDIAALTVEYSSGGHTVRPLDGLSLAVPAGQLTLLLGASGCGKTTLLSVLGAILTPASGTVRFRDIEVTGLSGGALTEYRRRTVGVVFQSFNLIPSLSAWENVAAPLWSAGTGSRQARLRALELLERVELGARISHRPTELSGGQQQRVAVARALAFDPPLLLADEPTAHLDAVQAEGVIRLLRDLSTPERVVIVATHDNRMLAMADRVVELTPQAADQPAQDIPLPAGETLFVQGAYGNRVYVVEEGLIELVQTQPNGREQTLAVLGHGRYFGEFGSLLGMRRTATARAVTDCVVKSYGAFEFRQWVHSQQPPGEPTAEQPPGEPGPEEPPGEPGRSTA